MTIHTTRTLTSIVGNEHDVKKLYALFRDRGYTGTITSLGQELLIAADVRYLFTDLHPLNVRGL